jgi:alkyl sulfatase-like protein
VLVHGDGVGRGAADARIRVRRQGMLASTGKTPDDLSIDGDGFALETLIGALDQADPGFAIVPVIFVVHVS